MSKLRYVGLKKETRKDVIGNSVSAAPDDANNHEAEGKGLQVTTETSESELHCWRADQDLKESIELTISLEWKPQIPRAVGSTGHQGTEVRGRLLSKR